MSLPLGFERYRGFITTVTTADPAAGAEVTQTVPTRQIWHVLGMRVSLVTDATVSNRTVSYTFDNGTTVFAKFASPSTQAASLTYSYTGAADGANATQVANEVVIGFGGGFYLPQNYRIRTATANLQAGDNFGAATLFIIRYTT